MFANNYTLKEIFIGKGDHDADMLTLLNNFCLEKKIVTGMVSAVGAVKNIRLGYYRQDVQQYVTFGESLSENGGFEIVHCAGNVSLKDDKPFCHLHVTVSDREGHCFGGHLMPGVKIYALEFVIHSYEGTELHRGTDAVTGLPLWMG